MTENQQMKTKEKTEAVNYRKSDLNKHLISSDTFDLRFP